MTVGLLVLNGGIGGLLGLTEIIALALLLFASVSCVATVVTLKRNCPLYGALTFHLTE
jgi:hypothetical protein